MLKRFFVLLIIIVVIVPITAFTQERLTGLSSNPTIALKAIQYKLNPIKSLNPPLVLPFIEDFSTYIGYPNETKFIDKQAFINNTYPIFPPSIGVATLDALDENGEIYAHANAAGFHADTLTSNFIRLDSIFSPYRAISIQDSLYFSFYFQPGGGTPSLPFVQWERIGNRPETADFLYLDFGYTQNGETTWTNVWFSPGISLDEWLNNDPLKLNYFKQILIPITQTVFLTDSFQFRFRNIASLEDNGINGWASNVDQWHIDYIKLDINRTINDRYPNDIAFVAPTTSCLEEYQAVPWSHYQSSMLKEKFDNKMANLSNSIKNASYNYYVTKNGSQHIYTYTCNNENIQPYFNNGLQDYSFHASPNIEFSFPQDGQDSATFTITHIQKLDGAFGDNIPANDTIVYYQKFINYFAYDDGTAEAGYSLYNTNPQPKSYLAVRFTLSHPDTLRALKIWFNRTYNNQNIVPFTIMVWSMGANNKPGAVIDSFPAQIPLYSEEFLNFATYYLDRPVPITGSFFVGIKQEHNTQLNIGYDQNTDARAFFFYKTTNLWAEPIIKGSPMIRPVVGEYLQPQSIQDNSLAGISIYPNPTSETLFMSVPSSLFENGDPIYYTVYDMYGKTILKESIQNETTLISVAHFAKGVYFIKCISQTGKTKTLKFIKQ
jgi:hypothetical protein